MATTITLPHGKIPVEGLPPVLKDVVMKLNENIDALAKEVSKLKNKEV